MNVVAIIPARGGSKGIPRKNIIEINNKPMISYSIGHALSCPLIDRVIVSTDSEEIRDIAIQYGAEVPFIRPSHLADDNVLDYPVFEHAVNHLLGNEGYKADIIVHLRPTTPLRKDIWLEESINLLLNNPRAHSVRSVSPVKQHPFRMFEINKEGYLESLMGHKHKEPFLLRRQDLPHIYYYNCVLDVTRFDTVMELSSMTGTQILPFLMNDNDVIDIDTALDLEIFKKVYLPNL